MLEGRTPTGVDESGPTPELCDWCGAVVADGTAVYDGKRLVTACGAEHMAQLQRQYQARPWLEVEQWAGKVQRAMHAGGGRLSAAQLAEATHG